jgi:hypothetical protein
VWRLQNFPGKGGWLPTRTRVKLRKVDDLTWEYLIQQSHYGALLGRSSAVGVYRQPTGKQGSRPYFDLEVVGYVKHLPSNETFVAGKARIKRKTFWVNGLLFLLISCFILAIIIPLFEASPFFAIILCILTIPPLFYWLIFQAQEAGHRFVGYSHPMSKGC